MSKDAIKALGLASMFDIMFGTQDTAKSIEKLEAEGQRELVSGNQLPREIHGAHLWELEQLGFKFGGMVDELFVEAELPAGWTKRATEHHMHNDLLDEQGRRRAGIFYKAAPYDRRADLTMVPRYHVSGYERTDDGASYHMAITDAGKVVKSFGVWASTKPDRSRDEMSAGFDLRDKLEAEAKAWLRKRRPIWHNPLLYWNEGPVA